MIIIIIDDPQNQLTIDLEALEGIAGIIRAISTSKIMKIIAIRKNRIEKGIRGELKKSNPHSNGDHFSRQLILFFEVVIVTKNKMDLRTKEEIIKTII